MATMKNKFLVFTAVTLSLAAVGCGKDKENNERQTSFQQNRMEPANYASERCFKHNFNLGSVVEERYALADFTLNADSTGAFHYREFSDANCTAQVGENTVTFSAISSQPVGSLLLLKLNQNGSPVVWNVPTALADGGYYFDVDAAKGSSGPYVLEPTDAQINEFAANPSGEGIRFAKQ
jgi:hypothetical protein